MADGRASAMPFLFVRRGRKPEEGQEGRGAEELVQGRNCLLYTSPSPDTLGRGVDLLFEVADHG